MAIEDILRDFMDAHPNVSVSYEGIKSRPYYEALVKRLDSGTGDDVFMIDHDTALSFEKKGYLADLAGLPTISTFSRLAFDQMDAEGTILYVPTSISAFGLYCNTGLLAAHGIDAPRTLRGVRARLRRVPRRRRHAARGEQRHLAQDARHRAGHGGGVRRRQRTRARRRLSADPECAGRASCAPAWSWWSASLSAATWTRAWPWKRRRPPTTWTSSPPAATRSCSRAPGPSVRVHDMAPDLAYEVHPYPVLEDRPVLVVNVDTRVSVNANGAHVEEAKGFAAFLTQPSAIERFANSQCSFSPLEGNAAPDDASLQPLAGAFAAGAVVGSDDNILLPVWGALRQSVASLLEGATAAQAEDQLRSLLAEGADASS